MFSIMNRGLQIMSRCLPYQKLGKIREIATGAVRKKYRIVVVSSLGQLLLLEPGHSLSKRKERLKELNYSLIFCSYQCF